MARQLTFIRRKVMTVIMLTSVTVLLIAIVAFVTYDFVTFRQMMVRTLQVRGDIVAENSSAAVIFNNVEDAHDVLASLHADSHMVAAALYNKNGKLLAKYPADISEADLPVTLENRTHQFTKSQLTLFQPVMKSGSQVGMLYLRSDLLALSARLKLYGILSAAILLGSGLIAFWLSSTLQKRISDPIVALVETTHKISAQRDFSVRAEKLSNDEIGLLVESFNHMLARLEEHTKTSALLASIVESSDDAILSKNSEAMITSWNKGAERLFGFTEAEAVGQSILMLIPAERSHEEKEILDRILKGERVEHFETIRRRKDGTLIEVILTISPIKNADGKVTGASKIVHDITLLKQSERELKLARDQALAASRAKDDFLAALSHELRTPLNPVLLLASESAADMKLPKDVRGSFDTIAKNVSLEARLIDDLLDLTRITRDKLPLDMQPAEVHTILQNAINTVRADMEQKGIVLTTELKAKRHLVLGDPVRMQQIFWNILKNAVKFTPDHGKITLLTDEENDWIRVTVIDTGIGMTPAERERVFNAFAQGDHAAGGGSHRFGGLGLGLAISNKLVELHSGLISATSDGRDKGATFVVELPLYSGGDQEKKPKKSTPALAASSPVVARDNRVLLVEDHEPTRTALAHLLARRGFGVVGAGSIAEARDLAGKEKFNLLISDIGLPDGDGYSLMIELHQAYGLKGIALTGYGMEEDVARSQAAGFLAHVTKPVHIRALEAALATALNAPVLTRTAPRGGKSVSD